MQPVINPCRWRLISQERPNGFKAYDALCWMEGCPGKLANLFHDPERADWTFIWKYPSTGKRNKDGQLRQGKYGELGSVIECLRCKRLSRIEQPPSDLPYRPRRYAPHP